MRFTVLLGLALVGCGAAAPEVAELEGIDLSCHGGLECLPDDDPGLVQGSWRMRRGWQRARDALSAVPPPRPEELDSFGVQAYWANFDEWLAELTDRIDAAHDDLDEAAFEDRRQRVVAEAVLGLIYEEAAREIASLPIPDRIGDDVVDSAAHAERLERQARAFRERSRASYRECAQRGIQPLDLRDWSRFCAARGQQLETAGGAAVHVVSRAETVVEVIRN